MDATLLNAVTAFDAIDADFREFFASSDASPSSCWQFFITNPSNIF